MKSILAAAAILLGILWTASGGATEPDFPLADFKMLTPDGSRKIGYAHFDTAEAHGLIHVRGQYNFISGDYDVDEAWLKPAQRTASPALFKYRHVFFHSDGSPERLSEADLNSGQATCSIYNNGTVQRASKKLDFPADTYAGPALVFPIRAFLRQSVSTSNEFHSFNCSPGPTIYALQISTRAQQRWTYHEGPVIEASVKPHFGPFDVWIAPFVPRVRLWFDPARDCEFIGAESMRYYKGLPFMMVPARSFADKNDGNR
jgi:hypothetical protein